MQNEKLLHKEGITVTTELCDDIIKECDEFLKGNEKASFYHHPLWLKILSMESGQPYYCLISRDDSGLINGILPLLKTRGIPFNSFGILSSRRISSLPRTPFAGPLTLNQQVEAKMLERATEIQNESPNYLLQLKTDYKINYQDSGLRTIEWRKSFVKRIPGPGDTLKFESHLAEKNILKNIRKAEQANIKFRQAKDIKELLEWYKLYLDRMRFHKVPARSIKFFISCWNILKPAGLMDLNLAVLDRGSKTELLSGNINFKFKNAYYGAFNAGNMGKSKLMFGDFLMYNQLLMLQEKGYKSYDFGEVPANHCSLGNFKKKWGMEQVQIYHNYYGKKSEGISNSLDFFEGDKLSTKLWRRVPLKVTAVAGKLVNKRL